MTVLHMFLVFVLSALFFVAVWRAIVKGRVRVRYALLWLGLSLASLVSPLFYRFCLYLHEVWLFPGPSVMLLLFAVVTLALICLQLSVTASSAWRECKNLAQAAALAEARLDFLERSRLGEREVFPG